MPTDVQTLSYLAGLIDGQGSVTTLSKGPGRPKEFTMAFESQYESLAALLQDTFGGRKIEKYATDPNRVTKHEWRVVTADAWHVYSILFPYLRVKNTFKIPNPLPVKWARATDHSL